MEKEEEEEKQEKKERKYMSFFAKKIEMGNQRHEI